MGSVFPDNLCRLCIKVQNQVLEPFNDEEGDAILDMIWSLINIKVIKEDSLPRKVCIQCLNCLKSWNVYKTMCLQNQYALQGVLSRNGTFMESQQPTYNNAEEVTFTQEIFLTKEDVFNPEMTTDAVNVINNTQEAIIKDVNKYIDDEIKPEENSLPEEDLQYSPTEDVGDISYNEEQSNSSDESYVAPPPKRKKPLKKVTVRKRTRATVTQITRSKKKLRRLPADIRYPMNVVKAEMNKASHSNNDKKKRPEEKVWTDENARKKFVREFIEKQRELRDDLVVRHLSHEDVKLIGDIISNAFGSGSYRRLMPLGQYLMDKPYLEAYKCKECPVVLPVEEYITHVTANHHITVGFPCDYCGDYIPEKYVEHWVMHYMNFECEKCKKRFVNEKMQRRHQRKFCYKKPYLCDICGMGFTQSCNVNRHKRVVHFKEEVSKKEQQACHICGKLVSSIKIHLASHSDIQPWVCPLCGKNLKTKATMDKHMKTHEQDRPKTHLCQYCGADFLTKTQLDKHVRNHEGVYPYHCQLCPKKFTCISALRSHMASHTDERKFECELCGKGCKTKKYLQIHMAVHNDHLPYCCPICGKRVRYQGNFGKHLDVHRKRGEYVPEGVGRMKDPGQR